MKTTLKRLSVCPCGFPALKETIPLGTAYEIDPNRTETCTWQCGGCGELQQMTAIFSTRPDTKDGYLPAQLFEPSN